ncbi:MAG: alkaline phosphatase family protein [Anaerolineales bacterium]|nr:alkaline phosphatase family protein [Anaerolineales bacterium]
MKLLILGIDGATFDLIRPWAAAGHLPNLARLMNNGVQANLASTMPPVTSPAWPTFMTGCNPGKHGVFDFIEPHGNNFDLVNSTRIRQPTIWQRLSQAGYRVGVLNVPVTYPPRPVNGFMITGILSPKGAQICYPAGLIAQYESALPPYRVAPNIQYKPGIEQEYIADLFDLIRVHGDWALYLMQHEPVDVLMVHFIALDIMMHALWRFMDTTHPRHEAGPFQNAIRDGYALVDAYIGRLLDLLPAGAHTIVMSDHGFGPLHHMVNLNIFLMDKGLLKLKRDPLTQAKAWAFRYGLTPANVYRFIERIGLQNLVTRVSKSTRNKVYGKFLSFDSVDWSRTVAYSIGHVGQIHLNVTGREPEGIVTQADYPRQRQRVIEALQDLRHPAGRPLVSKIISWEETYHGPFAQEGPDLHLILDDYNSIACPLFATEGKIISKQIRGDSGCHRREGIFIAHGPTFKQAETLPEASILDLAPTIMQLLAQPVPRIMDGRVLAEIFTTPPAVVYDDVEFVADQMADAPGRGLDDAETAQVEERLRSLGYL